MSSCVAAANWWHRTIGPLAVGLILAFAWPTAASAQPVPSAEPSRIVELEAELQRQRAIQAELRRELSRLQGSEPAAGPLAESIAALRTELAVLRERTGNRTELESTNQRLTELNAQLRQEVETLALELQTLRSTQARSWLLYGAGLLLAGLLAGVSIKARPRRSAWS